VLRGVNVDGWAAGSAVHAATVEGLFIDNSTASSSDGAKWRWQRQRLCSPVFTRKLLAIIEKQKKRQTHKKNQTQKYRNMVQEYTKCYKLARYLQRNVRAR